MIKNYFENGFIKVNVDHKPFEDGVIMCVEKGLWYKFKINEITKVKNGYEVTCNELISIDDKLINR